MSVATNAYLIIMLFLVLLLKQIHILRFYLVIFLPVLGFYWM